METTGLDQVVDKLAEKINLATDALIPIAKETLDQIVLSATIYVWVGAIGVLFSLVLSVIAVKLFSLYGKNTYNDKYLGLTALFATVSLILFWVSFISVCVNIHPMVAPLPYVFGL